MRRNGDTDIEAHRRLARRRFQVVDGGKDALQRLRHILEELGALRCDGDALVLSVEQLQADAVFELPDGVTDGRRRDIQLMRRKRETLMPGSRLECVEKIGG